MIVVPYLPEHGAQIDPQGKQAGERLGDEHREVGYAFTGMHDGRVIFCAGRAYGHGAWVMLSREAAKHMLAVTRCIKRLIYLHYSNPEEAQTPMEAIVRCDFPEAHRWMGILGFKKVSEDGEHSVYVRQP